MNMFLIECAISWNFKIKQNKKKETHKNEHNWSKNNATGL